MAKSLWRTPLRRSLTIVALGVTSASMAGAAAVTPATAAEEDGYETHADIAYTKNGSPQQTLDLYVPRKTHGRVPLVIYVHGGGWSGGDKNELRRNPGWESLLSKGFALASINYTLSGTAKFPQQIYDVKAAVRYLRASKNRYGLSGNIGLWGGSAGGQLAALAGTTCGVAPLEGNGGSARESSCVQAVVDMVGPTDFAGLDDHLLNENAAKHNPPTSPESRYLGCADGLAACAPSTVQRANPITYITSSSKLPPYLIAHGDADTAVPHWASEILFDALKESCADATFYTLHGQDHPFAFTGALQPPYPPQTVKSAKNCAPVKTSDGPPLSLATMADFFTAHLR